MPNKEGEGGKVAVGGGKEPKMHRIKWHMAPCHQGGKKQYALAQTKKARPTRTSIIGICISCAGLMCQYGTQVELAHIIAGGRATKRIVTGPITWTMLESDTQSEGGTRLTQ